MSERFRELQLVCRSAAAILASRRKLGIDDPSRDAWPSSTEEFFRWHARQWQAKTKT
jgi:hypothetical protein